MNALSALLALAALAPLSVAQEQGPSPERIEAASKALEAAFEEGDAAARAKAIRESVDAVDKRVIGLVAKGLNEKEPAPVVSAAVDTLGRMRHPESAKELVGYYKHQKKKLNKDHEKELVELLQALGRQGDPAGVEVLTDSVSASVGYPVIQARLMALAMIRDVKSVEAVFSLITLVGKNTLDRYMEDVRLSLMALTGEDRGQDSLQWEAWWRENKKGFKVSSEPKALPDAERARWNSYWGIEEKKKEGAGG